MSRASIGRVDEDRVRKVAADNPGLLHCRLAQRFGISVHRVRVILGVKGGELPAKGELAHYTPNIRASWEGQYAWSRRASKRDELRKKLRAQEDERRGGWNPDFKPARRPNGRGGPLDSP